MSNITAHGFNNFSLQKSGARNGSVLTIPGHGIIVNTNYKPNFYITLNFLTRVQSQVTADAGVTTGCLISGEVRQLQENRQSVKEK